mmetsp:Transcript_24047/g.71558  ORF Transcript_24047/g.71558 Transcript_24047/m.71558 type:complete len:616 (-) Transcript_24047:12-1859(-)
MPSLWAAAVFALLPLLAAALSPDAKARAKDSPIYPVDVREIACDGRPGLVNITGLQAGRNSGRPYILSFLRTTTESVNFSFQLVDAKGTIVAQHEDIMLEEAPEARRLHETWSGRREGGQGDLSPESITCEEFFLSDGRAPVELPDTWAEARSAFRDVCHSEGLSATRCREAEEDAFEGYPRDESLMITDGSAHGAGLCGRLLRSVSTMSLVDVGSGRQARMSELRTADGRPYKLGRRLKSGGTTSSGHAGGGHGGFGGRSGLGARSFGRGFGRPAAFHGTPRTTSYGYTGTSAYHRGMVVPIYAGTATSFMFWRMQGGGSGHHLRQSIDCHSAGAKECTRRCSACATCEATATKHDANRTVCWDADKRPCSGCSSCDGLKPCYSSSCVPGGSCGVLLGGNVTRDDLFTLGFVPQAYAYPLHLVIGNLSGAAFKPEVVSQMCPPANWAGFRTDTNASDVPWLFTEAQDLFVQLAQFEDFKWEVARPRPSASSSEAEARGLLFALVLTVGVCCACVCAEAALAGPKGDDLGPIGNRSTVQLKRALEMQGLFKDLDLKDHGPAKATVVGAKVLDDDAPGAISHLAIPTGQVVVPGAHPGSLRRRAEEEERFPCLGKP